MKQSQGRVVRSVKMLEDEGFSVNGVYRYMLSAMHPSY